jgi:hypothetical protein
MISRVPTVLPIKLLSFEDINRKPIRYRLISRNIWMQPITTIILLVQHFWVTLVCQEPCQIHSMIKCPTFQDPLIDLFPRLLSLSPTIPIIPKWHNRAANRRVPRLFRIAHNLRKRCYEIVSNRSLRARAIRPAANIIDPLEDHEILDTRLIDCVALIPCQQRGT